eukprot:TRINITY_DN27693_c0_g1_i1.p1 TRINITY_DN27693_c0_g1~~TRINITY_DN27693_c0_g1_i1.p1  ORF type:complete len:651 (-),score=184.50 TRINITY_DN27693_c0_g1_i1:19-1938(-)
MLEDSEIDFDNEVDEKPLLKKEPQVEVELEVEEEEPKAPMVKDNKEDPQEGDVDMGSINVKEIMRLLSLAKKETKMLIIATIALIFASAGNLVVPPFVGKFVDSVIDNTVLELTNYVLVLLGVFLIVSIFALIRASLFEIAGQRIVSNLRAEVFAKIISQEIGFFDKSRTGELINRLSADCEVIQNAVTVNVSMFLRGFVQLLGAVAMCFYTSWKLTLVVISIIPLIIIFALIYGKYIRSMSKEVQDALAEANAFAEETIGSMQTVRAFTGEKFSSEYYSKKIWTVFEVQKKRAIITGIWASVAGFIASLALAGALWFGGKLCKEKEITAGTLTSFLFYTLTVVTSVGMLAGIFADLMKALGASRRIFYLLERVPEVRFLGGKKGLTLEGRVKFTDVSFSYPSRPNEMVLRGFNLEIDPGKVVALVGQSGGGKTTVAKLLAGFYYPNSGKITVDGHNIHHLEPSFWRSHIGIVSQEPTLFAISIKDNIAYSIPNLDHEKDMDNVIQVSKMANAHEFIQELTDKYDTLVGERGVRLSGGQKQRVAIARALMKDPQILIFDEATSALDSESEYKVQSALDELISHRGGKGVLVIAHRLSTVKNADEVVVIDHGSVVERGTHEELMQNKGVYAELVARQLEN